MAKKKAASMKNKSLKKVLVSKNRPRKSAKLASKKQLNKEGQEKLEKIAIGEQRACVGENIGKLLTVEALAFDFDYCRQDQSPADWIRVLKVKNKPPKPGSKEQKPGGHGLATGQVESNETVFGALKREIQGETGHKITRVIDLIRTYTKRLRHDDGEPFINDIFFYLVEVDGYNRGVVERDEIDASVEPWMSLREFFTMPFAQDRFGKNRNPDGIYFSHVAIRLEMALKFFLIPDKIEEGLRPSKEIEGWLDTDNHRKLLDQAMQDMYEDGTLERFYRRAYPEDYQKVPEIRVLSFTEEDIAGTSLRMLGDPSEFKMS